MPADAAEIVRLAERVEQSTGPDRELDADILAAIFPTEFEKLRVEAGMPSGAPEQMMTDGAREYVKYRHRFWFTASLDAAMTLIPSDIDASGERFRLEEYTTNGVLAEHVRASAWVPGAQRVYAATPALALTAACLRARARAAQHDHEVG